MENASKALIMAGGILISIMVASFMIFALRKAGRMSAEYDSQLSDIELADFNSQFEAYAKDDNTFFDIITVSNLAYDVNKKNGYDAQNSVQIKLENQNNSNIAYSILSQESLKRNHFFVQENTSVPQKYMYDLVPEYTERENVLDHEGNVINQKYKYRFKCIQTAYSQATGKVTEMKFKIENN